MVGKDFSLDQGITTVPNMTPRERAQAVNEINTEFARFYRDNYFRFSAMYAGSLTIQDKEVQYAEMLPTRVLAEMMIPS
jgi:translation initiation factor RLI1